MTVAAASREFVFVELGACVMFVHAVPVLRADLFYGLMTGDCVFVVQQAVTFGSVRPEFILFEAGPDTLPQLAVV